MSTNSYADYNRHWGQLEERVKVNPELAPFEPLREQLQVERAGLVAMMNQQGALKVQVQENTRAIEGHVTRGRALATRLRDAIKAVYGRDHEKLTEFGVPVRRARSTSTEAKKKPSETGPNPNQTATPETESST